MGEVHGKAVLSRYPAQVAANLELIQVLTESLYKKQKKAKIHRFFAIFSAFFPNIWPLAGPNIAKKGWPLQKLVRGDRQIHFGTFNFWVKPGF